MRKVIVYIAQSLDGFIATKDDSVAFLDAVETDVEGSYPTFYETIDTVVMGRRTYDWICDNTDVYPYLGVKSIVVTSKPVVSNEVSCSDDIVSLLQTIKVQEGKDIWIVGGAKLVQTLLAANCIDELQVTIAPVLIGDGIPLFNNNTNHLDLVSVEKYGPFAQLNYKVKREGK